MFHHPPYFFCIFRILPFVFPFPAPAEPGIVTFVVAAPKGDAGMVAEPLHVVDGFLTDVFQKLPFGGIEAARKHEVLPDEDAVAVAKLVEKVAFVGAAAPDAEHVHVGVGGVEDGLFVLLWCDARQEVILRDIVGTFGKYGDAVQFYVEGFSIFVRAVDDFE
mgnify:CR=1 FL=1